MSKYIHQQQIRIYALETQLAELQQENAVLKKALELACDVLRDVNYRYFDERNIDFETDFIHRAKESMK